MILLILTLQLFATELFRFGPDNHMLFVEAHIPNHDTPYLFRIDPTMRYSVLTDGLASRLQLVRNDFRGNEITTTSLRIDDTALEGTFFIVQGSKDFPLWGGVVGADMLEEKILDINLPQNSLSFVQNPKQKPDHAFALSKDGIVTQIRTRNDKKKHELQFLFRSTPVHIKSETPQKRINIQLDGYTTQITNNSNPESKESNRIGLNSLSKARIILDMKASRMAISKPFSLFSSKRKAYTTTLLRRYEHPSSQTSRIDQITIAKLYIQEGEIKEAIDTLQDYQEKNNKDPIANALLQKLQINTNTLDKENITIENLKDYALSNNWVGIVNQLWLENEQKKALELTNAAVKLYPKQVQTWLALCDILTANGDYQKARNALGIAKTINNTPFAYTLRSAMISYLCGDKEAAISYIRQRLQQPTANEAELYAYTRLFSSGPFQELFIQDIKNKTFSSDFQILALQAQGEMKLMKKQQALFLENNCSTLHHDARKNCIIWINALAGKTSVKDVSTMKRILKKYPYRSDYWDTYAVVLYNKNKTMDAQYAIQKALTYDPDNTYMLFQYHWFAQQ